MEYFIGIDVGTTGTKALLFDAHGEILHRAYRSYPLMNPAPEQTEQNPMDWYQAVCLTVKECTTKLEEPSQVTALSISAQGGTLVLCDESGRPIRNAISWLDRRAKKESEELCQAKEEDYYYLHTGWRVNHGYHLAEIKWLVKHEPELIKQTRFFLSPLDFLNLKLSGEAVSDYTNVAITNLEDIRKRNWEKSIFDDLGIKEKQLPRLAPAGTVIGTLTKKAASELNLSERTLLINGGYDQYCAACGLGAVSKGDVMLSTGTAWVLIGITDQLVIDRNSYIAPGLHVVPNRYGVMASLETGGVSLEWIRNKILSIHSHIHYNEINRQAEARGEGANGLLFYPYFAGSTCPTWDSNLKSSFLGLTLYHDGYDMARAVMEGVVYAVDGILQAFEKAKIKSEKIKMTGGATKSPFWSQMISDITGIPVELYHEADSAAIGAGIIAAVGSKKFEDFSAAITAFKQDSHMLFPDEEKKRKYQVIKKRYWDGLQFLRGFYREEVE